jgi:hypothetical protein
LVTDILSASAEEYLMTRIFRSLAFATPKASSRMGELRTGAGIYAPGAMWQALNLPPVALTSGVHGERQLLQTVVSTIEER